VVVGTAIDDTLDGELRVTVVATGLGQQQVGAGINRGKATGTNGMHIVGGQQQRPTPAGAGAAAGRGQPSPLSAGRPSAPAGAPIGGSPYSDYQSNHRGANTRPAGGGHAGGNMGGAHHNQGGQAGHGGHAGHQSPQGHHGGGQYAGHQGGGHANHGGSQGGSAGSNDMDLLDIPAFLRRQAD